MLNVRSLKILTLRHSMGQIVRVRINARNTRGRVSREPKYLTKVAKEASKETKSSPAVRSDLPIATLELKIFEHQLTRNFSREPHPLRAAYRPRYCVRSSDSSTHLTTRAHAHTTMTNLLIECSSIYCTQP